MIVTNLKGNSKSNILLISEEGENFVRKQGDIIRNLERYSSLDLPFPKLLRVSDTYYDIEYIKNLNVASYLTNNSPSLLLSFLDHVLSYLSKYTTDKDYTEVYSSKLDTIDLSLFPFTKNELIYKLPKNLPSSRYFGDLTFDNILFDTTKNSFILIDGLTSEFDSFVFDLHKLKQDVLCKWFIRKEKKTNFLDHKLFIIHNHLCKYNFYTNNYLTILMLLRVYPYCKDEQDRQFITNEVNKLWI